MPAYRKVLPLFLLLFLFLFLRMGLAGLDGFGWDNYLWAEWAKNIRLQGLQKAYATGSDYPPLYQYFLWLFGKINGDPALIYPRIYYLRIFTLAFEFASLWLVCRMNGQGRSFLDVCVLSVFNVAFFYNTVVWGQVDGLLTALVFASIYFAWKKWYVPAALFLVLSLNFKVQAVVFLPLWLMVWSYGILRERKWGAVILSLLLGALLQYAIVYPFTRTPESTRAMCDAIFGSVGRYPFVSLYAYNMWYWIIPGNPRFYYDGQHVLLNLTRKQWGLLLFFGSSLLALWPILRSWWTGIRRRDAAPDRLGREQIYICAALVALLFFFCNTQMHERYSHPAFLFLLALALRTGDYKPYVLFSVAYFLNMEGVLQWFNIKNHISWLFSPSWVAFLFLLLILLLLYRLYIGKMRDVFPVDNQNETIGANLK